MTKQELIKEMKDAFEKSKQELGFKVNFEELDGIFFITDSVLNAGFVSNRFSRQICSRIVETYVNWNNYFHSLVLPNPQNMINITESNMLNQDEKQEIKSLMTKCVALISKNTLIGLTKNKKQEADFIDSAVKFWNEIYSKKAKQILEKVTSAWKEREAEEV